MNEDLAKMDPLLLQLILSLQAGAMQQMGKIASPIDGKVERDLKAAQFSIDILDMLDKKTERRQGRQQNRAGKARRGLRR
jgi:hypothetical protein